MLGEGTQEYRRNSKRLNLLEPQRIWPPSGSHSYSDSAFFWQAILWDGQPGTFNEVRMEENYGWCRGPRKALDLQIRTKSSAPWGQQSVLLGHPFLRNLSKKEDKRNVSKTIAWLYKLITLQDSKMFQSLYSFWSHIQIIVLSSTSHVLEGKLYSLLCTLVPHPPSRIESASLPCFL